MKSKEDRMEEAEEKIMVNRKAIRDSVKAALKALKEAQEKHREE